MSTDLEQKVMEYYSARTTIRTMIRESQGRGLSIEPALVRRVRNAEEALLAAGRELSTQKEKTS